MLSSSDLTLARSIHREQVWAAMIRAVLELLDEAQTELREQVDRAQRSDDVERLEYLLARLRVLKTLREEVGSPPPGA